MLSRYSVAAAVVAFAAGVATSLQAQMPAMSADSDCARSTPMDHTKSHAEHLAAIKECESRSGAAIPTASGQAAYAAIAEVVRILEADSTTDWSKVNIETLRQHLIDMDEVTLHSDMVQRNVAGGITVDVTGHGRTVASIQRMAMNHARMLDQSADYSAKVQPIPDGARVVITAKQPSDARLVARIRGLGYAGLLTEGDHHARHHIALARGDAGVHSH